MRLYRRGAVWWCEFRQAGKVVRASCKTRDRAAARKFAEGLAVACVMPTFADAVAVLKRIYGERESRVTLAESWVKYTTMAAAIGKAQCEKRTTERKKARLDNFIKWLNRRHQKVKCVADVTGLIAAEYGAALAKQGLKTKTRRNIIGDLGTVWRVLEKCEESIKNPFANICPADTDGETGKAFSREDEAKVLNATREVGKGWFTVCMIMRDTGMRYGDVARLKVSDIDFEARVIRAVPHKTARHCIKLEIPFTDGLAEIMKDAVASSGGGEYLFPLHEKYSKTHSWVGRKTLSFGEVLKAAGLYGAGYTVHSWRHTAATRMAEAGVSKDVRKMILGHTTEAMAERYDHASHLTEMRAAVTAASRCGK